jgi:hypothetical protein
MQKVEEGAGGRDDAPVSLRLGPPWPVSRDAVGHGSSRHDVIRSDDDLLQGPPSPAAFCLSRQLHDWQSTMD